MYHIYFFKIVDIHICFMEMSTLDILLKYLLFLMEKKKKLEQD